LSKVNYKDYLGHEIKVKLGDGILEHSQNWQWFVEYIEENYNLSDIDSFCDFNERINPLIHVFHCFLNILEICNRDLQFKDLLLSEIYLISKYYVGAIERERCSDEINTKFAKILFLVVWITKLQNSGNATKYIIDDRFLKQRNFHQAINMLAFDYDKEAILLYLENTSLVGFEEAKQNIEDNLNKVVYNSSEIFLKNYEGDLLSVNCFDYQLFDRESNLTWQENTLLDMLKISIREGKIEPMFSSGDSIVPDYRSWTPHLLDQLKSYFNHSISNYVIESVDFLLNRRDPSLEIIETHCKLLMELISKGDTYDIISSSTYKILAMLFSEGVMDKITKTEVIRNFYKTIHSITSINLLLELRQSFPINKNQIRSVKDYIENQYKDILLIKDIDTLTQYLGNADIARCINQKYYNMTKAKFLELIEGVKEISVANLFYQAMLFLLEVNRTNQNIDKRIVKQDMINIQAYWQHNIYQKQVETLHEYSKMTKVPKVEVEKYNNSVMINPIVIAKACIISKESDMISTMEHVSEHAIIYLVNRITLRPIFPMKDKEINFDRHDTDNILKSQVEGIIEKYGYKFMNILSLDIYVSVLHKQFEENAKLAIAMFDREKELYTLVEELLGFPLIPYEGNITLGHLTQLFPLLEIEIRHLGKLFGIVPFKESLDEFMKFKDPSSILRELLDNIYRELNGFENAPDLLFVYHFMYNSNSLNIRNECIHGREYIEGNQIRFGFKVTLLALYMVKYRRDLILTNTAKTDRKTS